VRRRWRLTSAVAGGDSGRQRLTAAMDEGGRWALTGGGNGQQLWQQWTIDTAFNGGSGGGV
jgi:hypothetical protein